MTHPKTPIEQAVAALESCKPYTREEEGVLWEYQIYDDGLVRKALAALRASTGKMKAAEEIAEKMLVNFNDVMDRKRYATYYISEAQRESAEGLSVAVKTLQEIAVLHPSERAGKWPTSNPSEMARTALERIQLDAQAAAQPEPRPLKELIAEGHEWFTLIFEETPILVWRESDWDGCPRMGFKDSRSTGEVAFSVFADCPAIPILKPTVTPHE